MATVNFSVPEDVKRAFHAAFADQNKSAVITALMREAVERRAREARHQAAVQAILYTATQLVAQLAAYAEPFLPGTAQQLGLRTSKLGDYATPLPKRYTGWAQPLGW